MKPPVLPSDSEIEALVRAELAKRNDAPRACVNCSHWFREERFCPINRKRTEAFMLCNHHKDEVDALVEITKRRLLEDATESKKIDYLLSTALSLAEMTVTMIHDVEKRLKKQRSKEEDKLNRVLLKRDLNLCEDLEGAYSNIAEFLRKAEQQYVFYVQPHFDDAFTKKNGEYNIKDSDNFNHDKGEFIQMLLKYCKGCFLNEENSQKVFACLDSLENDQYFPLTEKDIDHYKVRL